MAGKNYSKFNFFQIFRLNEENDRHARHVRQLEDDFRSRLAELQEEKSLALEEKELQCSSLIAREQANHSHLREEVANLKLQIESKSTALDNLKEEGAKERQSWIQQIEDNRRRHLEEMEALTAQQDRLRQELERRHADAIDTAVLELKDSHRREVDAIQQQHEELLQAANESMEVSAKNQLEQLRNLLRDKESELASRNNELDRLKLDAGAGQEAIERLERELADRNTIDAECLRLKEDLNSRHIQVESLENQIKVKCL